MKKCPHNLTVRVAWLACALVTAFGGATASAQSATETGENPIIINRNSSSYDLPVSRIYTGRSPFVNTEPAPARPAEPRATPPPKAEVTGAETCWGLVKLQKTAPATASIGENITYVLTAVGQCDVADVVITDTISPNATYVSSDPAGTVEGKKVTWKFPGMARGETKPIRIVVKAVREGELVNCATVTAVPIVCVTTVIGKPVLTIRKTGPATAVLGADVTYSVVVANTGTTTAKNVVLTDPVPQGMGGSPVTVNIGDLAPNQSRTVPVTFKATQRGRFCNVATAESSNAGRVTAEACTVVQQPGVKITKEGDREQFLGRRASYRVVVSNTGDTTLTGVVVTDTAPAATSIVDAGGGTVSGNTITWNVGELATNATRTFTVVLTSSTPGNHCNTVAVRTAQGQTGTAEACTLWRGIPAVLLEVVDDPDPVAIGTTTTYTIRVTNQGTADMTNIAVVADYDDENTPASSPNGTVNGQKVTFPTVARLAAKQSFTYTITVRGVKAGDARNKVTITAAELRAPVVEEESTTVY